MSVAKISASCVATASGMPASSVAANRVDADRAAGQERLRSQRRQGRIGDQLAGEALDAEPRELGRQLVVAWRGEAGDQFLELACGVDPHLHPFSGTAVEQLAGDRIGAQEGGGSEVVDAQAGEQGIGGIAGAGGIAAEQLEVVLGERLDLRPKVGRRHAFGDDAAAAGRRRPGPSARRRKRWRRSRPDSARPKRRAFSDSERRSWLRAPRCKPRRAQEGPTISIFCGARFARVFRRSPDGAHAWVVRRHQGATRIVGLPVGPRRMVRGGAVGRRRGVYRSLPAPISP